MDVGKLNRRVAVLRFFKDRDEYGGEVGEWRIVERLWANIKPVSGTEYFSAQQVNAETTVTITIRYNPRISVLNRISYQGKLYEIIGVSDAETAHTTTVLNCKEMVEYGIQCKAEKGQDGCGGCR